MPTAQDAHPTDARPLDLRLALRLGLLLGLWLGAPLYAARQFLIYGRASALGQDAHAYWLTAHSGHLYGGVPGAQDSYLYSPLFAQMIRPLAEMPFAWFYVVILAVEVTCVVWLLRPLGWLWVVPLTLMCSHELVLGNVIALLTVCVVLGLTGGAGAWSLGWLTKVVPGVLGLTWLSARDEWGQVLRMLAWTGALTAFSFALWPKAWLDWAQFLQSSSGSPQVRVRAVSALVLVAVGARRGWWWVVPVGLVLGVPVVNPETFTYLAALPRLRRSQAAAVSDVHYAPPPQREDPDLQPAEL